MQEFMKVRFPGILDSWKSKEPLPRPPKMPRNCWPYEWIKGITTHISKIRLYWGCVFLGSWQNAQTRRGDGTRLPFPSFCILDDHDDHGTYGRAMFVWVSCMIHSISSLSRYDQKWCQYEGEWNLQDWLYDWDAHPPSHSHHHEVYIFYFGIPVNCN